MPEGKYYYVKQGDSAESLAAENGLLLKTIWEHSNNAELKNERQDPHVLHPGDHLFIPAIQIKEVSRPTDATHKFVRKGVPSKLRVVILENDKPRANERYLLIIDGEITEGKTKADGSIEHPIPPVAKEGKIILSPGQKERVFKLQLGGLDPITEVSGVQGRLKNLGFPIESVSNELDEPTVAALKMFQKRNGLPVTGETDETTRNRLKEVHGS